MKDVDQSIIDKIESKNFTPQLEQYIDWDGDNVFEETDNITDYLLSATITKKLEGNIGINTYDDATVTVDNSEENFSPKNLNGKWSGNVVPERYSEIYAGIKGNTVNIFGGYIKSIKPKHKNAKASIKLKDNIDKLKDTKCPDKFYNNEQIDGIVKDFLNIADVYYTSSSIDIIPLTINENFVGKNMWQAIQSLANSVWARVFIEDGTFYFRTRLSPEYDNITFPTQRDAVYTFGESDNYEIKEKYTSKDIYNEVNVVSKPLIKQDRQSIWTGAKKESTIQKSMSGSDITNSVLQLSQDKLPIIEGKLSIINISAEPDVLYTVDEGNITVNYNTGEVTFTSDTPTDSSVLRVKYDYGFKRILPNKTRSFIANLDYYSSDVEQLNILAREYDTEENEELNVSFSNDTADIYVYQEVLNGKRVKFEIINNTSTEVELYGYSSSKEETENNMLLFGSPFIRTNVIDITKKIQDSVDVYDKKTMSTVRNDYIPNEEQAKRLVDYLLYQYSTPMSMLEIEVDGLPHLQLMDVIHIDKPKRDIDNDFVIMEIKHKFKKDGTWYTTYKLRQAHPSDWVYDGNGFIGGGTDGGGGNDFEAPNKITNITTTIIKANRQGNNRIAVSWDKSNALDLDYYNIYRKHIDDTTFKFIKRINKGTTNHVDTQIDYGETYFYVVTAVDKDKNESVPSDAIEILILPTDQPTLVKWGDINWHADSISLNWYPVDKDEYVKYEVRTNTNFGD